jgi:hypothetical protein
MGPKPFPCDGGGAEGCGSEGCCEGDGCVARALFPARDNELALAYLAH